MFNATHFNWIAGKMKCLMQYILIGLWVKLTFCATHFNWIVGKVKSESETGQC